MTNLGNLTVEADVMVCDPYYVCGIAHQHNRCAVLTGYGDLREDFADMNQMTRKGSDWRNFRDDGDLSTMEFSVGSTQCLAIEKRGPRWGIGRVYVIHANVCRNDRRAVDGTDVEPRIRARQLIRLKSNAVSGQVRQEASRSSATLEPLRSFAFHTAPDWATRKPCLNRPRIASHCALACSLVGRARHEGALAWSGVDVGISCVAGVVGGPRPGWPKGWSWGELASCGRQNTLTDSGQILAGQLVTHRIVRAPELTN
jgi:hypothetical protein